MINQEWCLPAALIMGRINSIAPCSLTSARSAFREHSTAASSPLAVPAFYVFDVQEPYSKPAEWYSCTCQVRSLRKRIVKKALGLMEQIDNIKSNMLHSILVHANDAPSEFSEPASGAVSEASEAGDAADASHDVMHEAQDGVPAVSVTGADGGPDPKLQPVVDALQALRVADEEARALADQKDRKEAERAKDASKAGKNMQDTDAAPSAGSNADAKASHNDVD